MPGGNSGRGYMENTGIDASAAFGRPRHIRRQRGPSRHTIRITPPSQHEWLRTVGATSVATRTCLGTRWSRLKPLLQEIGLFEISISRRLPFFGDSRLVPARSASSRQILHCAPSSGTSPSAATFRARYESSLPCSNRATGLQRRSGE